MSGEDRVARVVSIQVALPRVYEEARWQAHPWSSAFAKSPVEGPIWLGRLNLVGDRQGDTVSHGGAEKAVLCYAASHYPAWEADLGVRFPAGGFGENLTIEDLSEETVCIGDSFRVGEAVVQVCQPRIPCWKISHRWNRADLTKRVEQTGRTGWYLRVLTEGTVQAGNDVILLDRPHPTWTVARATRTYRERKRRPDEVAELRTLLELAAVWQRVLDR